MTEVGTRSEARGLRVVGDEEGRPEDLVGEYLATLGGRSASTVESAMADAGSVEGVEVVGAVAAP